MIGRFSYYILNMSIMASFMIVILLLFRAVFYKVIPKSAFYYMWGIILARLIIPVSIPSKLSILNIINSKFVKTVTVPRVYEGVPKLSIVNYIQKANEYFPLDYKSDPIERIFNGFGMIWIIGTILLIVGILVIYMMTAFELNKAVLVKKGKAVENGGKDLRIFETDFVSSPIVFGILKPKIIIPKCISKEILEFALLHEFTHIKRFDNLWRSILVCSACVHWFNPFVWLFLFISRQDMELSCDEMVIKGMTSDKRKLYAKALSSLAIGQKIGFTGFGGSAVKTRLMNIVVYKPVSLIMAIITGAVCIAVSFMLITNPIL